MIYLIRSGRPLAGEVTVQGSKNAALPALVATLVTDEEVRLVNIPRLRDVATLTTILRSLGKGVESTTAVSSQLSATATATDAIRVFPLDRELSGKPPTEPVRAIRASFLVLGPLLARLGEAEVALPGGDAIGLRPVDLHLRGLQAMGAEISLQGGVVRAKATRLRPAEITLSYPSVGATEHLLMTAALIPGRTVIHNPAQEPEVGDLAGLLQQMGAGIRISSTQIEIEGRAALSGATHAVIPDRLCAGTFVIAAALTGGNVLVRCHPWHLRPLTGTLTSMGVQIHEQSEGIRVSPQSCRSYQAVEIETRPYPGFPTDMHPPIVPLLSLTPGESRVRETVFEDRFAYAPELRRMGADLDVWGQTVILRGVRALRGAEVRARRDNRAGVALVLAGLAAEGTTIVHDEEDHILRGHSDLAGTLRELGAEISTEPCVQQAHDRGVH